MENSDMVKAKETARKICGYGTCACGYSECNSPSRSESIPCVGNDTVCPIAKYNIEPNTATLSEYQSITFDDLRSVCFCCKYCDFTEASYVAHCLDCPIAMVRDYVTEVQVEAACS